MIETFVAVVAAILFVFIGLPWLLASGGAIFGGLLRAACAVALIALVMFAGGGG